jgi:hypothetical protein
VMRATALAMCFSACLTVAVSAQETPQAPDIVVTSVRQEQVQAFVSQVSAVPPSADQIARWDNDICMSVVGPGEEQAQFVVDQISYRAQAVGLTAGATGCDPNVFIFFVPDSDTFAPRLVEDRKSLFAYYHEEHVITLGRDALTAFAQTSRPIRWWHVAQTRSADGHALGSDQAGQNSPPPPRDGETRAGPDGLTGVQAVRSHGSRLRAAERQDFNRVVVIVDASRAAGYTLESLSDYIAMVTLAQIDPNARPGDYPTILNLFASGPETAPGGMTAWDQAYLSGLYRSTRNAASASQQVREISRRMVGEGG